MAGQMAVTEYGGRIDVFDKQGENRAAMSVNQYGNGAVSTWDKNGNQQGLVISDDTKALITSSVPTCIKRASLQQR